MSILYDALRRAERERQELGKIIGAPPPPRRSTADRLAWWLVGISLLVTASLAGALVWFLVIHPGAALRHSHSASTLASKPQGQKNRPANSSKSGRGHVAPNKVRASIHHKKTHRAHSSAVHHAVTHSASGRTAVVRKAKAVPVVAYSSLPDSLRVALPTITVSVHVWSRNPKRRFIVVGNHTYHQGAVVASGVRLLRITRNGMIVNFKGHHIRIPSQ